MGKYFLFFLNIRYISFGLSFHWYYLEIKFLCSSLVVRYPEFWRKWLNKRQEIKQLKIEEQIKNEAK